ncbi:hypothetical protein [Couchioplanes azureus]|nr:hypothetical protein [Couchioplanes caeruleus]
MATPVVACTVPGLVSSGAAAMVQGKLVAPGVRLVSVAVTLAV